MLLAPMCCRRGASPPQTIDVAAHMMLFFHCRMHVIFVQALSLARSTSSALRDLSASVGNPFSAYSTCSGRSHPIASRGGGGRVGHRIHIVLS